MQILISNENGMELFQYLVKRHNLKVVSSETVNKKVRFEIVVDHPQQKEKV
jgi:hypothetical protein